MKHTQEEYDALIKAMLIHLDVATCDNWKAVKGCMEPFRELKSARIGLLACNNDDYINITERVGIELTDAVKTRLGPSANIDTLDLISAVNSHKFTAGNTNNKVEVITELIANAAPEIEGEL